MGEVNDAFDAGGALEDGDCFLGGGDDGEGFRGGGGERKGLPGEFEREATEGRVK